MHEDVRGVDRVMGAAIELPRHYIETETSLVQRALRSLKHGEAFAVFDDYGDIGFTRTGPEGIVSCLGTSFDSKASGRSY